jgi:hypothetical protein
MKKIIGLISLSFVISQHLLAQGIETFNYSGSLNANGWTTHSGATPGQQQTLTTASDQGNSLYYNGLPNSTGNRSAFVAGNTEDVNLALTGISGVGYYSFLLKVANTTGLSTTGEYFTGFGQTTGASVTIFAPRVFIKAGVTPNTFQLGIQNTTGGTPTPTATYGSTEYPVGTTLMVVVKLDATTAPIQASLFVNPNVSAPEPTATVSSSAGTNPFTTFASIFLRQSGTAAAGTGNLEIDEIRYGSTWESVTPENSCVTTSTISVSNCNSYTVPSGGATYTLSGTYYDTIPNAALCDSIITINLTIATGITYYADSDGDGLGNPNNTTIGCSLPVGYVTNSNDCDDNSIAIGLPTTIFYLDGDSDGFGSPTNTVIACTVPSGYVSNNQDCNDNVASINPNGTDIPDNGIDEDCSGGDATALGTTIGIYEFTQASACPVTAVNVSAQPSFATFSPYGTSGTTCAAANNVFNNSDWNTAGTIDLTEFNEFSIDAADCYTLDLNKLIFTHRISASGGTPSWVLRSSLDNYAADLATGLPITTDKIDTVILGPAFDAVDQVTFRFYIVSMAQSGSTWRNDNVTLIGNSTALTPQTFYADVDGDGFGNLNATVSACSAPANYVLNNTDCNDNDSLINPTTVWYQDVDSDGIGNQQQSQIGCAQPNGYVLTGGDCDDNNNLILGPVLYYTDADNDGFGDATITTGLSLCNNPGPGYATNNTDCDDSESTVYPGATEICDGLDNDCLNGVDDGLPFFTYYEDNDGDNFGGSLVGLLLCEDPGAGYATETGDCNDNDPDINPDAMEILNNGIDENCDGTDNYLGINQNDRSFLEIFPNPSDGLVTLRMNASISNGNIRISSANGSFTRQIEFEGNEMELDLTYFESGIYFIEISDGNFTTTSRIVIK